jgi:hypothetical protein
MRNPITPDGRLSSGTWKIVLSTPCTCMKTVEAEKMASRIPMESRPPAFSATWSMIDSMLPATVSPATSLTYSTSSSVGCSSDPGSGRATNPVTATTMNKRGTSEKIV